MGAEGFALGVDAPLLLFGRYKQAQLLTYCAPDIRDVINNGCATDKSPIIFEFMMFNAVLD